MEESKIEVEEDLSNYKEDFNDSLGGGGIEQSSKLMINKEISNIVPSI